MIERQKKQQGVENLKIYITARAYDNGYYQEYFLSKPHFEKQNISDAFLDENQNKLYIIILYSEPNQTGHSIAKKCKEVIVQKSVLKRRFYP